MTDREYLESKGWRLVKIQRSSHGAFHQWDHAEHQHSRRGFFLCSEALAHQKKLDKGFRCRCVKEVPLREAS